MNISQKAYFKFCSLFKNASPSVCPTVKPILLYSSEIWSMFEKQTKRKNILALENTFKDQHIEKLNIKFCKYLLGVNKKASNLAVRGELGRYPLYIDVVLSMIKYWIRFHDHKNKISDNLLTEALKENYSMSEENQHCWLTCIKTILYEIGMNDIYHNPAKCTKKTIKDIQTRLKLRYVRKWQQDVACIKPDKVTKEDTNKLRTYKIFKTNFKQEKYLSLIITLKKGKSYPSLG